VMDHLAHQDCLLIEAVERLERQRQGGVETLPAARMDEILRRLEENDRRLLELMAKVDAASLPPRGPAPSYRALREAGSPDPDTSLTEAWENEGGGTGVPAPQRSGA